MWVCKDPNALCNIAGDHGECVGIQSPDSLYYDAVYGATCERSIYDNAAPDELPNYWDCTW